MNDRLLFTLQFLIVIIIYHEISFTADELQQEGSTADKNYIALKIDRSAKHIQWLKKNQKLLTILLSYCSLHGASGGDLAGDDKT